MSGSDGLELHRPSELAPHEPTANELIQQALALGPEGVAVIERLVKMKHDEEDRHAKRLYIDAMASLQAKLPQFHKDGKAKNSKYAKLESLDEIVRPLTEEFGFSISFDEVSHDSTAKTVTFEMVFSHRGGYREPRKLTVPIDVASKNAQGIPIRQGIQDTGSTVSYARRYLLKMHLNIIEVGEDTDGEKIKKITPEQVAIFEKQLAEPGMNLAKFLAFMRAEKLSEIFESDLKKAQQVITEAQTAIRSKASKKDEPK